MDKNESASQNIHMSKNGGECVNKKLLLFNIVAVLLLIGVIAAFL